MSCNCFDCTIKRSQYNIRSSKCKRSSKCTNSSSYHHKIKNICDPCYKSISKTHSCTDECSPEYKVVKVKKSCRPKCDNIIYVKQPKCHKKLYRPKFKCKLICEETNVPKPKKQKPQIIVLCPPKEKKRKPICIEKTFYIDGKCNSCKNKYSSDSSIHSESSSECGSKSEEY